jgi:cytochrome b
LEEKMRRHPKFHSKRKTVWRETHHLPFYGVPQIKPQLFALCSMILKAEVIRFCAYPKAIAHLIQYLKNVII